MLSERDRAVNGDMAGSRGGSSGDGRASAASRQLWRASSGSAFGSIASTLPDPPEVSPCPGYGESLSVIARGDSVFSDVEPESQIVLMIVVKNELTNARAYASSDINARTRGKRPPIGERRRS